MANSVTIDNIKINGDTKDIQLLIKHLSSDDDGFSYDTPQWTFDDDDEPTYIEGSTFGRWNDFDFILTFIELLKTMPSLNLNWHTTDPGWSAISSLDNKYYTSLSMNYHDGICFAEKTEIKMIKSSEDIGKYGFNLNRLFKLQILR